ncbi:hypothetical protein ACFXK0_18235 [Nocardia sp. NPDC059177]|uniref:hypothetical protein n=1 Tax=Nocardia sp. NPDC059177 TaxID=3346759 RepID=UPI00369AB562
MAAIRKTWIGVVAGVTALVLAGCAGGDPQAPGTSSSVRPTTTTTSSQPVVIAPTGGPVTAAPIDTAPGATGAPTTPARPGPPPTPATGTVVLRTATLSGVPVPAVPVYLSLQQPCDPASHDIPVGETTETQRLTGVTDSSGLATFTAATGCYRFGMTAPAGTNPVPEGMHTLFLVDAGATVTGQLRFQDTAPEPAPACAESTIETELGVDPAPVADISGCDGQWAVVRWASPGDNQRIITRASGTWTTYVLFPHTTCWDTAAADGVPDRLRQYFNC